MQGSFLRAQGFCCRARAPELEEYKAFIDAGWFLDIAPYASRSDGFTFQTAARALAGIFNASFDRCLEARACSNWVHACLLAPGHSASCQPQQRLHLPDRCSGPCPSPAGSDRYLRPLLAVQWVQHRAEYIQISLQVNSHPVRAALSYLR